MAKDGQIRHSDQLSIAELDWAGEFHTQLDTPRPNPKVRVEIPSDPTAKIALLKKAKAKHDELAANSLLKGLKWDTLIAPAPALARADTADQLSDDPGRKREKATGERDVETPTVTEALRSIRDVLLGLNRDNPDALGDYGFGVSDASSSPPPTPPPAK